MKFVKKFIFLILILGVTPMSFAQENLEENLGLDIGEYVSDISIELSTGKVTSLADLYRQGTVVVIFYRGAWCPYCNLQLQAFEQKYSRFKKAQVEVLAVSVDKKEYGQQTVSENRLSYLVASDNNADLIRSFNLVYEVPEELAESYMSEYNIDLSLHSGKDDRVIAVPATFMVNSAGKIIFSHVDVDYTKRIQPEVLLALLEDR